jgi:predicted alpha/beta-hydrolase family hydrolase
MAERALQIDVSGETVSALLDTPDGPARGALVLAHGAGAGMRHPFMAAFAGDLALRGVATLRYQFPYVEQGRKRVDPPAVAHAAVRAAVSAASACPELRGVPLFAGGKSFGGRMTSQAQAEDPLPGVSGLVFVGFPLHPPDSPGTERSEHLARVQLPLLFLQGTRDEFARLDLLRPVIDRLADRATLLLLADGDHSFRVRRRITGLAEGDVRAWLADGVAHWMDEHGRPGQRRA